MKKKFGQTKVGTVLKSLGLGAVDTLLPVRGVVAGAVEGVKRVVDENKRSETAGIGKIDWIRLASAVGVVILILAVVFGWIDMDMFKELVKEVK